MVCIACNLMIIFIAVYIYIYIILYIIFNIHIQRERCVILIYSYKYIYIMYLYQFLSFEAKSELGSPTATMQTFASKGMRSWRLSCRTCLKRRCGCGKHWTTSGPSWHVWWFDAIIGISLYCDSTSVASVSMTQGHNLCNEIRLRFNAHITNSRTFGPEPPLPIPQFSETCQAIQVHKFSKFQLLGRRSFALCVCACVHVWVRDGVGVWVCGCAHIHAYRHASMLVSLPAWLATYLPTYLLDPTGS